MKAFIMISALTANVFALTGCAHVLTVTDGTGKSLPGVPFFQKKAVCRQETTYISPIILVTKTVSSTDSTGKLERTDSETKPLDLVSGRSSLEKLRQCLSDQSLCGNLPGGAPKSIDDVWNQIAVTVPVPRSPEDLQSTDIVLVGNTVSPAVFVDYQSPAYLNGKLPWLGSNEVSVEINADGSLSKASGKSESKISDLIPISAGLSKIFHLSAAPAKSASAGSNHGSATSPVTISLAVDVKFSQYKFTKLLPIGSPCNLPLPIAIDDFKKGGIEFTWSQEISSDQAPDEKGDKTKKLDQEEQGGEGSGEASRK